jgi:hypothetical protein
VTDDIRARSTDENRYFRRRQRPAADVADRIAALVRAGQRDEAVQVFLTEAVAVSPEMVAGMRTSGMWGWFTGLALGPLLTAFYQDEQ